MNEAAKAKQRDAIVHTFFAVGALLAAALNLFIERRWVVGSMWLGVTVVWSISAGLEWATWRVAARVARLDRSRACRRLH